MGGAGLVAGGAIGGLLGARKSYKDAREQGVSRGEALLHGAVGATGGASKGALIGTGVGLLGGAGAGALLSPGKTEAIRGTLSHLPVVGQGSQFVQRQVHGLTGWAPEAENMRESLRQIGMGSSLHDGSINAAKKRITEVAMAGTPQETLTDKLLRRGPTGTVTPRRSLVDLMMGRTAQEGAAKGLSNAYRARDAATNAENMGLTNIPGYLESLKDNGVGATLGAAAKNEFYANPTMTAAMVGLPALGAAHALVAKDDPNKPVDPNHPNEGRLHRAGANLLSAGSSLALGPMPLYTQKLVQRGLHAPGHLLSKRMNQGSVMGPVSQDLTATSGQAVPTEHHVSERAAGSLGEGSPS